MLWLALWFPDLPLAAFAARPLACVVVARGQVVAADELARAARIVPGMRTATARGLLPEIAVLARDPAREAALVEEIACWAGRFTPTVSLAPPAALLLEIGGSRQLFGGATRLLETIQHGGTDRGLDVRAAAAPTPLAALWLARGDPGRTGGTVVERGEALPATLAPLPVAVMDSPPDIGERLASFGVRRLGDVFALPRAGLARRLGRAFAEEIERALGERPDPRPPFTFPPQFFLRLELPQPAGEAAALAFAARRLVEALCGWLAQRQAGITGGTLSFDHGGGTRHPAQTRLEWRCASPTREPERLMHVLRERLERSALAAPVEALSLHAEATEPLAGRSLALFDRGRVGAADDALACLVERLCARLGERSVHGLVPHPDHRPECATRAVPLGTEVPAVPSPAPARPLWLLAAPESLPEIGGRPHRHGVALELLAGPEHIASGWWDAGERHGEAWGAQEETAALGDVRRDYFIARTARHECYWIFRDREGWFLHGIFT